MEKQKLWRKLKHGATKLGKSGVYESIILYYTLNKKGLPARAKMIILVALSYYVWSIDFIPDLAAIIGIGLLDDVIAIAWAHRYIMVHTDAEIRKKGKAKMESLFKTARA
ncbi:YkvA family protein [Bacillus sp. C1]